MTQLSITYTNDFPDEFQNLINSDLENLNSWLITNKILALAGLTRARQCMGNNFTKGERNLQKSGYTKFLI